MAVARSGSAGSPELVSEKPIITGKRVFWPISMRPSFEHFIHAHRRLATYGVRCWNQAGSRLDIVILRLKASGTDRGCSFSHRKNCIARFRGDFEHLVLAVIVVIHYHSQLATFFALKGRQDELGYPYSVETGAMRW